MLAEDLPLLGCDGVRRLLYGLLKESPVGPRIQLGHEDLHILPYQVLFVLISKDLAETHVTLCDQRHALLLP